MVAKPQAPWAQLILLGLANYPGLIGFWFVTSWATVRLALEGESASRVGWVAAAPWAVVLVLTPWVEACVRRLGWRGACVAGYLALVLAALGLSARGDFGWVLGCGLVAGVGLTLIWVVPDGWAGAFTPPEVMGRMVGWFETLAGTAIGVGPALCAWTGVGGASPGFVAVALPAMAALAVCFVRPAPVPKADGERTTKHASLAWRAAGVAGLLCLLGGALESGAGTLLPVLGLAAGLPEHQAPLLMTAANLAQLGLQFPLGWAADRWGARRLLVLTASMCVVAAAGLAIFRESWGLGLAAALFGMGAGAFYSLGRVLALRRGGESAVVISGRVAALYTVGVLVGAPVAGGALSLAGASGFAWVIVASAAAVWWCASRLDNRG
jgi:MFS family permease